MEIPVGAFGLGKIIPYALLLYFFKLIEKSSSKGIFSYLLRANFAKEL